MIVAMIVFSVGTYAVNSIILGWVSATCSQTKEKKACSLAIVNCLAVASFIWTPYMWPKSDEPRYVMAMSSSAGLSVATAAGAWAMRITPPSGRPRAIVVLAAMVAGVILPLSLPDIHTHQLVIALAKFVSGRVEIFEHF